MKHAPKRATVNLDRQLHRALGLRAAERSQSPSANVNDAVRRTRAEDAEDIAAFKERAREGNVVFETVLKNLRKRGVL